MGKLVEVPPTVLIGNDYLRVSCTLIPIRLKGWRMSRDKKGERFAIIETDDSLGIALDDMPAIPLNNKSNWAKNDPLAGTHSVETLVSVSAAINQ